MTESIEKYGNEVPFRGDVPCMDCKTKENIVWWTDNVFWNAVMREVEGSGILCTHCFVARAEKRFKVKGWRVIPEFDYVVKG
jgi:hypothetical protein